MTATLAFGRCEKHRRPNVVAFWREHRLGPDTSGEQNRSRSGSAPGCSIHLSSVKWWKTLHSTKARLACLTRGGVEGDFEPANCSPAVSRPEQIATVLERAAATPEHEIDFLPVFGVGKKTFVSSSSVVINFSQRRPGEPSFARSAFEGEFDVRVRVRTQC